MDTFRQDFTTGFIDSDNRPGISPQEVSLIVSMLSAGTVVGALLAAPAGDIWGRRLSLIAAVGVFCVGAVFQVCATNIALLVVGRFVTVLARSLHIPCWAIHSSGTAVLTSSLGRWLVLE
jgi:predicted MFS family arabinose efflux permease